MARQNDYAAGVDKEKGKKEEKIHFEHLEFRLNEHYSELSDSINSLKSLHFNVLFHLSHLNSFFFTCKKTVNQKCIFTTEQLGTAMHNIMNRAKNQFFRKSNPSCFGSVCLIQDAVFMHLCLNFSRCLYLISIIFIIYRKPRRNCFCFNQNIQWRLC